MKCLCLIAILICTSLLVDAQTKPSLGVRIEQVIKQKELGWRRDDNGPAFRVVPRNTKVLAEKSWYRAPKRGGWDTMSVGVYEIESSSTASIWLKLLEEWKKYPGWEIEKYELGDEAYLGTNPETRTYILQARKGDIVVRVAGNSLETVKRFARYVFPLVDAI